MKHSDLKYFIWNTWIHIIKQTNADFPVRLRRLSPELLVVAWQRSLLLQKKPFLGVLIDKKRGWSIEKSKKKMSERASDNYCIVRTTAQNYTRKTYLQSWSLSHVEPAKPSSIRLRLPLRLVDSSLHLPLSLPVFISQNKSLLAQGEVEEDKRGKGGREIRDAYENNKEAA